MLGLGLISPWQDFRRPIDTVNLLPQRFNLMSHCLQVLGVHRLGQSLVNAVQVPWLSPCCEPAEPEAELIELPPDVVRRDRWCCR